MAVLNLNISQQYKPMAEDILKGMSIIVVVHLLYYYCSGDKKGTIAFGLMDNLFNNKAVEFMLYVIIGYLAYYMVVDEIVHII
jgi:hypothetical protein